MKSRCAIFRHPADGEVLPVNLANTSAVSYVLGCQGINCGASWGMLKAPQIRFCRASDGVRIAYATTGSGPAMIEVATWLNHLEFDWQSPVWRPRLVEMAKNYTMARYDGRGCGLSDRVVEDLSFDANLRDLEAVADAAGLQALHPSRLLSRQRPGDSLRGTPSRTGQQSGSVWCVCTRQTEAQPVCTGPRRSRHDAEACRARLGT